MTFTRRRWDLWCLGGAVFLALGGLADPLFLSGSPWRPLGGLAALALWPLRFHVPPEGRNYTPISGLPPARRRLILWCAASFPGSLGAAVLTRRVEAWWIWPILAAAHLAVTFRLAWLADLERSRV